MKNKRKKKKIYVYLFIPLIITFLYYIYPFGIYYIHTFINYTKLIWITINGKEKRKGILRKGMATEQ